MRPTHPTYRASIIIPTYDRQDELAVTLDSLKALTTPAGVFEVVVVDDGSRDRTHDVVRSYERDMALKYVYQPDDGFRAARARNLGVAVAEGAIAIFMDSGVAAQPGLVDAHLASHARPGRFVIGYAHGIYANDKYLPSLDPKLAGGLSPNGLAYNDPREICYRQCGDDLAALRAPWALGWTVNVSVPLADFRAVGGFDENYRSWGAEDVDLAMTMHRRGLDFVLNRDAAVIHYPHPRSSDNGVTNRANKAYLHSKFGTPETELFQNTTSIALNLAS